MKHILQKILSLFSHKEPTEPVSLITEAERSAYLLLIGKHMFSPEKYINDSRIATKEYETNL